MSGMSSLQISLSALLAQQRGLDVTGHNIANAGTAGFSRQRVDTLAQTGATVPAIFSTVSGAGGGVRVADVTRARDAFLEIRSYLEHSASGALDRLAQTLASVEQVFTEPQDAGLQSMLSSFWSSWDEVANHPGDAAARTQLLARAGTLTAGINDAARTLGTLTGNAREELGATVDQVNTLAANVAKLNQAIQTASVAGVPHNDLLDQRDMLLSQLSDLVGISTYTGDHDVVDVFVDGGALVRGATSSPLLVDSSGATTVLRWGGNGVTATTGGGSVAGMLTAVNDVIPRYRAALDAIARDLRDAVNGVHGAVAGTLAGAAQDQSNAGTLSFSITLDGGPALPVDVVGTDWSGAGGAAALGVALQGALDAAAGPGAVVATVTGGNGTPITITLAGAGPGSRLTVAAVGTNPGLATLLGEVALGTDGIGGRPFFSGTSAADLAVDPGVAGAASAVAARRASGGALDARIAAAIAELANAPAGPDARYRDLVVGLGVESQSAARRSDIQRAATTQIDRSRDSVSGVNLDEEMVSMLQFQHAYNAAARYLTAIDETLSTLIQHTGRVGT
jgi:flagellar hook-associated protein 1 FlgK